MRKLYFAPIFVSGLLLSTGLYANMATWTGGTSNDLSTAANWSPTSVPGAGDEAVFDSASRYHPQLTTGESLTIQLANFTGSTPYTFAIQGAGATFTFAGTNSGTPGYGVISTSLAAETFNISSYGALNFQDSSNAWPPSNSGSVVYNVGTAATPTQGEMSFLDTASAGNASINVVGITGAAPSIVDFNGNATAASATIVLGENTYNTAGALIFTQASDAGNSSITVSNSSNVSFQGTSSGSLSTIDIGTTLPDTLGFVSFANSSTADNATISVMGADISLPIARSYLAFIHNANAGNAQITVGENTHSTSGVVLFDNASSAGSSNISLHQNAKFFFDSSSTAASSTITVGDNIAPAIVHFEASASAGSALIGVNGGGTIYFEQSSNAQHATINLDNSSLCSFENNITGGTAYSSAGTAKIYADGTSTVLFTGGSTADSATLQIGTGTPGPAGSILNFQDNTMAATASIYGVGGSVISFMDNSDASNSHINLGQLADSTLNSFATLQFQDNATANMSTINANTSSSVTFSGTSTAATSTIALNGTSTLTFQGAASSAGATINIASQASAIFAQTNDDTFTGSFTGAGQVFMMGTNNFTYAGDSDSFTGSTTISNGNFILNGILAGDVFVNTKGIISGNGSMLNNLSVTNGGSIVPGNSIGILNVAGNFTQSNSTYEVQVNSVPSSSLINVTGTATLGPDVNLVVTPIFMNTGLVYTTPILHAGGGLTGSYAGWTVTNPLLAILGITYDPNNAYLTFQNALSVNATTYNEQQVANQLITIVTPTAEQMTVMQTLVGLPADEQVTALDQMSAQQYTTLLINAEETTRSFIRRLYDPLRSIATEECCMCDPCHCYPCHCASPDAPNSGVWTAASWERATVHGNKNCNGFKRTGFEISLGIQHRVTKDWTLGVAGTYERDDIGYNVGGSGRNNIGLGGLYALYRPENYYFLADIVLGASHQKVRRPIDVGSYYYEKHGRPTLFQSAAYIEGGFDWRYKGVLVQPFLGFEFGFYNLKNFGEHSTDQFLDVYVKGRSQGTALSRLGVHFKGEFSPELILSIDAAWQYRLASFNRNITEYFTTFGTDFTTKGIPLARSSFDGVANLSYVVCDSWSVYAEAMGQQWSDSSTFSILAGAKYIW